jgi:hypothetical protein
MFAVRNAQSIDVAGELAGRPLVHLHRFGKLREIAETLIPTRRLAGVLHGGEQQPHQRADDGDDDQQLDQGEGAAAPPDTMCHDSAPCSG